ncbi:MAG: serine/threonine protein phosphatase [Ruminococcaceae bacterium]|nr:serine/threonine protein phosphatase [Oscillospiraceae bacterium]
MAIYALADLHLSFGTDKPMDVFGDAWDNYTERIFDNWQSIVKSDDLVIIPGDISWATYIEDAYEDFNFINRLNGKKAILKGNHDYWWTTLSKMNKFLADNSFDTITILNNTAISYENAAICGTRGWWVREDMSEEDIRILEREKIRLVLSCEAAAKHHKERIIVGLHYPPVDRNGEHREFLEILKEYKVDTCVYGHLHSHSHKTAVIGDVEGVDMKLVSGDFVDFTPILV